MPAQRASQFQPFAVLQEEESKGQQRTGHSSTSESPPIYVTGVRNMSPVTELLQQIAKDNMKKRRWQTIRLKFSPKLLNATA
jgi:hypothetical protein